MSQLVAYVQQVEKQLSEFAVERTANATIRHFEDIVAFNPNNQVVINGNLAKLIFDYCEFVSGMLFNQIIEQGCFTGSKKTG